VLQVAEVAIVETFSLIARREFQQDISLTSANRRRQAFLYHAANDYEVIQVTHQTFILLIHSVPIKCFKLRKY